MAILLLIVERLGITDDDIEEAKVRAAAKPAQKDALTLSDILEILPLIAKRRGVTDKEIKEVLDPVEDVHH